MLALALVNWPRVYCSIVSFNAKAPLPRKTKLSRARHRPALRPRVDKATCEAPTTDAVQILGPLDVAQSTPVIPAGSFTAAATKAAKIPAWAQIDIHCAAGGTLCRSPQNNDQSSKSRFPFRPLAVLQHPSGLRPPEYELPSPDAPRPDCLPQQRQKPLDARQG